jgi:hypothetical protein
VKTATYGIQLVAVFCPECNEAHYDKDGHDWSPSSFGGLDRNQVVRTPVTCDTCGTRFKLPRILLQV